MEKNGIGPRVSNSVPGGPQVHSPALFITLNTSDPAKLIIQAYLKTTCMCVGAGLELNSTALQELSLTHLGFKISRI